MMTRLGNMQIYTYPQGLRSGLSQHVSGNGQVDMWEGGVWYGNPPDWLSHGPNRNGIDFGFMPVKPVKAKPYHIFVALNENIMEETHGSRVICLNGRLRLQPTHFFKGVAKRHHLIGSYV